jgi:hypothetical protein
MFNSTRGLDPATVERPDHLFDNQSNAVVTLWDGTGDPDLKRREIEKRYRDKAKANREKHGQDPDPAFNICPRRVKHIDCLFVHLYGGKTYTLPDDDAGRDNAYIMVCHLAGCPHAPRWLRDRWLKMRCPWMDEADRRRMIARKVIKFGSDTLARRLGVTYELRKKLRLWTIGTCDMSKAERELLAKAEKKRKDQERAENRRRAAGARPRAEYEAQSANRTKPWLKEGISKATWYRRKKQNETSASRVLEAKLLASDEAVSISNRRPKWADADWCEGEAMRITPPHLCPACRSIKPDDHCRQCGFRCSEIETQIAELMAWTDLSPAFLSKWREMTGKDARAIDNTAFRHEAEIAGLCHEAYEAGYADAMGERSETARRWQ